MKSNYFENVHKIHFIGIGGVSMSALALLMKKLKKHVSGTDRTKSEKTTELKKEGIEVFVGEPKQIVSADLVVYTDAIDSNNIELKKYREMEIPCLSRGDFLEQICKLFDNVIAVAGAHGKTTTTAMLAHILLPKHHATLHLGGEDLKYGNFAFKGCEYFITEACEYKKNIEKIFSSTAVVTNIDLDHTDCYKNLDELKRSFQKFINQASEHVIVWEDVDLNLTTTSASVTKVGFGENCQIRCFDVQKTKKGYVFSVNNNGQYVGKFVLNVDGEYNIKNAMCAIAICLKNGIGFKAIYNGIKSFCGVKRRNETLGKYNNAVVVADYAHHPTEIINSIKSAKEKYGCVSCFFQPHTYTRTLGLMKEFSTCFAGVDNLVIYKTYPAREKEILAGNEKALYKNVNLKNKKLAITKSALYKLMEENSKNNGVILVLGAGDLYEIVKKYLKYQKNLD